MSTYSALKIELIGVGEQSGTWGTTTNVNLGTALEEAIVGRATANFTTDADLTISLTNTNATQTARNFILNLTSSGSLTATRNLVVPTINKPYIVENNTTGGQSITVKTSAGSGVTVPNGRTVLLYANSTNVVSGISHIPSLTLATALAVSSGGTGLSAGTSGGIPYFSSTSAMTSSALLAANALMIGGGAGGAPTTTTTGSGVLTALGNNANASGGFVTSNGSATLTTKRIDPRVSTAASASTLTPDISAFDQYNFTALAASLAINAPVGTPVDGNRLIIRLLDNGTTRTLTWDPTYTAIGVSLPGATSPNKTTYVGCIYNSTATRWDVVAVVTQA